MLIDISIAKPLIIDGTDYSRAPISMARWIVARSFGKTHPTASPHPIPQLEMGFHAHLMRFVHHGGKIHAMAFPKSLNAADSLPYESEWGVFVPVEEGTVFFVGLRFIISERGSHHFRSGRWCPYSSPVPLARDDARRLWVKRVVDAEWAGTVVWSSSHLPHEPEYITTVALHPTPSDPELVC